MFTSDETRGAAKVLAVVAHLFLPFGLIVAWLMGHKKYLFVREHCAYRLYYFTGVLVLIVGLLLLSLIPVVGGAILAVGGFTLFVIVTVDSVRYAIYAANGRIASEKKTRCIIRDRAFAGDERAIGIIRSDPRYSDILAEYEASRSGDRSDNP